MKEKTQIYLTGFMGVGKSAVSHELCRSWGMREVEMDGVIQEEQQMAISQIFQEKGEAYFRELETALLRRLKEDEEPLVVSCGGGAVMRRENVALMKERGVVVLLTAEAETIYQRVKDSRERPLLNGNMNPGYIRKLMEERRPKYEAAADIQVATDGRTTEDICREILDLWKKR